MSDYFVLGGDLFIQVNVRKNKPYVVIKKSTRRVDVKGGQTVRAKTLVSMEAHQFLTFMKSGRWVQEKLTECRKPTKGTRGKQLAHPSQRPLPPPPPPFPLSPSPCSLAPPHPAPSFPEPCQLIAGDTENAVDWVTQFWPRPVALAQRNKSQKRRVTLDVENPLPALGCVENAPAF